MPLLNPPDILPEAMRFILRALVASPAREAEEAQIVELVAPDGLPEAMASIGAVAGSGDDSDDLKTGGKVIARESLRALRNLEFVEINGSRVAVADRSSQWRKPTAITALAFSTAMRRAVFEGVLTSSDAPGSDLVAACALLAAAPDPLRPFTGFDQPGATRRFNELKSQHRNSAWSVANLNLERWRSFRRMSPYLGLARLVRSSKGTGLIADSSSALAEELDLPPGRYEAGDFVAHCAAVVPFLDGGPFDQSRMVVPQDGGDELSPGLSLSLRQLESAGLVRIPPRESDTRTKTLTLGRDPSAKQPISHLEWVGKREKRSAK